MILLVCFKCINQCYRKVKGIICLNVQLSPDIPDKWDPGYFVEENPALSLRNNTDNGDALRLVKILGVCSDQDADLRSNFPVLLIICQYRVWYPACRLWADCRSWSRTSKNQVMGLTGLRAFLRVAESGVDPEPGRI